MRYDTSPSAQRQLGLSQNWAMDTRRQALDIAGRRQGLELGEIQRKRDAIRYLLQTVNQGYQNKKAEQAAEKAQKDAEPGFFGSGGGAAVGAGAGMALGALLAIPTAGLSIPAAAGMTGGLVAMPAAGAAAAGGMSALGGAALGGLAGGAVGGIADVAMAPGTPGAMAGNQRMTNMPGTMMAYDQYYGQGAQKRRQAQTDLLEARTGAYQRQNQPPPNWPAREEINKLFDEYMRSQKSKKLVGDPTFTSPFGLQTQYQPR